jgi:hypothetical protein
MMMKFAAVISRDTCSPRLRFRMRRGGSFPLGIAGNFWMPVGDGPVERCPK